MRKIIYSLKEKYLEIKERSRSLECIRSKMNILKIVERATAGRTVSMLLANI